MKKIISFSIGLIALLGLCFSIGYVAYNNGYETAENDITTKLTEGDCINWIEFQCPGGDLYLFCEQYEIKEITGGNHE